MADADRQQPGLEPPAVAGLAECRLAGCARLRLGRRQGEMNIADASDHSPLDVASANEMEAAIDRAMQDLPEVQRKALVLFSVSKLPQKEVAEMLGLSVEAVKWHVFTAARN